MFKTIYNQLLSWLVPSRIIKTLLNVVDLWKTADAKDRGLLLIVFFPMLICIGGMGFSLISFVLFVLPSFVIKMFMWGALVMLFNYLGNYGYGYLTGRNTSSDSGASWWSASSTSTSSSDNNSNNNFEFTDVSFTEDEPADTEAPSSESAHTQNKRQAKSRKNEKEQEKTPAQKWYDRVRGKNNVQ